MAWASKVENLFRKKSVLLIYWSHPFGAAQTPTFAVADAFRALGWRVDLLDSNVKNYKLHALWKSRKNYDLAIGFGPLTLKKSFFGRADELYGDIFYMWQVDPFIYDYTHSLAYRDYVEK